MKAEIDSLDSEHIQVEYVLVDGKANKMICKESIKAKVDLIIIGVSDKNVLSSIIYKSTASYVIEHVRIPVLVIPLK